MLMAVGVALLVVASCAPGGPILDEPRSAQPDTQAAGVEPRRADAAAQAAPDSTQATAVELGELSLAVVGDPVRDPLNASVVSPTDMAVVDFLYDGLTVWDVDEDGWAPGLATDLQMANGGLVWTVTMGPATFSDGSDLLASDVERSFRRVLDAQHSLAATRLEMVTSVVAVDDRTVRFELSEPFADLPALLSSPVYGIVPSGPVDGSVGSGPMTFTDPVTLSPREQFSLGLTGVRLEVVPDLTTGLELYSAGEVDVVFVGTDFVGEVDVTSDAVVEAHYVLNVHAPSLLELEVRRAVLDAVSRSAVVAEAFGDAATVIGALVPSPQACAAPCGGHSVPEAVSVAPISLAYAIDDDGREKDLADALVSQFVAAGIDANATGYDIDGFIAAVSEGRHDLIRTGWVGLFPSSDSQLAPYLAGSLDNVSGYADATFDGLIVAARTSGNDDFYDQARSILDGAAITLPLARLQVRALTSDAVEGLRLRHDGSIDLETLVVRSGTG